MKRTTSLFLLILTAILASCAPAPAPVYFPTLMPAAASAPAIVSAIPVVATVETFYKLINNVQSPDDFSAPWDMLTNEEQCNPPEKCELSYFQARWMESKVIYKIYECGPDHAIAEERLYPRTADPASASPEARLIRFQLSQGEEKIYINERRMVFALEEGCVLVVDSALSP